MARAPRGGGNQWIGARATPGAMAVTIALAAAFIVLLFLRDPMRQWVAQHLALVPRRAIFAEPWQIVTAGIFSLGLGKLVSSGIGVWIFGTTVEQQVGRTRMLVSLAAAQILGMLAVAVVGRALAPDGVLDSMVKGPAGFSGASPGVTGLIAAFGVYYGPVPLRFFGVVEMRGRTMALVVLGLTLFTSLLNQEWVMLSGDVAGGLVGWGLAAGVGAQVFASWDRLKLWRLRRRYKVIPGGRASKRYLN